MTLQHKYVKVLAKVLAPEEVTVRWWHQMVAPVWVVAQNGGIRLGSGTRLGGSNKWWHQTQHRLGGFTPRVHGGYKAHCAKGDHLVWLAERHC